MKRTLTFGVLMAIWGGMALAGIAGHFAYSEPWHNVIFRSMQTGGDFLTLWFSVMFRDYLSRP